MKLGFKRGEKGFTLVELMVVMAIMAVLAAIVIPAVTGTKQTSVDTQVTQDATVVETGINSYNADSNVAESLTTDNTTTVLGEAATQITSSKWPEQKITTNYSTEFRASPGTTVNTVKAVIIKDEDGTTLYSTSNNTLSDFVAAFTAINMSTLVSQGYLPEEPNGFDLTYSSSKAYHNYLWLTEKVASGNDPAGSRAVEVFSLTTIAESSSGDTLTYQRIF